MFMKLILFCVSIGLSLFLQPISVHAACNEVTVVRNTNQGFDANAVCNGIVIQLTPALGLTKDQVSKMTSVVLSFLQSKSQILPLLQKDKSAYDKKFDVISGNLKTKLNGILLQSQMNTFLSLKPSTNTPNNILSHLFY